MIGVFIGMVFVKHLDNFQRLVIAFVVGSIYILFVAPYVIMPTSASRVGFAFWVLLGYLLPVAGIIYLAKMGKLKSIFNPGCIPIDGRAFGLKGTGSLCGFTPRAAETGFRDLKKATVEMGESVRRTVGKMSDYPQQRINSFNRIPEVPAEEYVPQEISYEVPQQSSYEDQQQSARAPDEAVELSGHPDTSSKPRSRR